jgi:antitoxin component YwqK of YwqJK toxin-antitoxin module
MDEKPKVTGFYVHGKKDSKWSYWDKFAHQRFEIYEMDELLFKWGWEYYDNNQVKEEFVYIKTGVLHGEWYAYYKDGSHRGFRGYDNGLRDGAWIDWYTNGQKSFERKYKLDQPVDKWFYWYFFGELMSEVQYENNEIIGQQCFQSSFMYSKPAEELRDCSNIVDPRYINRGVFRIYSPSKVLIKETFINDDELLAQFEYHDNSEPSTIALFRQGEIIFFKRWNPEGIEIVDDPDPSGLFSSWDYYLNGNVKYKVTYMGIEKKEKHGIEWSYYNDRTWEQINLFYRGELQLSRKWTHGASISVDTLYQDGKKVYVN